MNDYTLKTAKPEDSLITIYMHHEALVTIKPNGDLEYGKNYTPDAAAKIFWETLAKTNPAKLMKEIESLEASLKAIKEYNDRVEACREFEKLK